MQKALWLVVMGVSGCGKSSLGTRLADQLQLPLIEGDEYHSTGNIAKMRAGTPLTDADRGGWLDALARALADRPAGAVLTCSALKRAYRDRLRAAVPGLRFVFMDISQADALARVRARAGSHFFNADLVANQFATLESPTGEDGVLTVAAAQAPAALADEAAAWARRQAGG